MGRTVPLSRDNLPHDPQREAYRGSAGSGTRMEGRGPCEQKDQLPVQEGAPVGRKRPASALLCLHFLHPRHPRPWALWQLKACFRKAVRTPHLRWQPPDAQGRGAGVLKPSGSGSGAHLLWRDDRSEPQPQQVTRLPRSSGTHVKERARGEWSDPAGPEVTRRGTCHRGSARIRP